MLMLNLPTTPFWMPDDMALFCYEHGDHDIDSHADDLVEMFKEGINETIRQAADKVSIPTEKQAILDMLI